MSENAALYKGIVPNTIEAFKGRCCVLPIFDSKYIPPTREEKKAMCSLLGLDKEKVAFFTGGNFESEDWFNDITEKDWRMLLYCSGIADPLDELDLLKSNRYLASSNQ